MARERRLVREPVVGQAELKAIRQAIYDTEAQPVAAPFQQLTYFTAPLGQNDSVGIRKTLFETNLRTSGQLPKPKFMEIYGIKARLLERGALAAVPNPIPIADIYALLFRATLTFRIGDATILETPLDEIPQGAGISGLSSLDAQAAPTERLLVNVGSPSVYEALNLSIGQTPIRVSHGEQISAIIRWEAAAPVVTVMCAIRVTLTGALYPPVE